MTDAAVTRRRGAQASTDMATSLKALAEQREQELPGRRVFSLKCEGKQQHKVIHMEGAAQKQELKGIVGTWLRYFKEKEINAVLFDAVERMLHLLELPENPYLFLANQLRTSELSFGLAQRDIKYEKTHRTEGGVDFTPEECDEACPITGVTCVQGFEEVWGAANVLKVTDPEELGGLLWRVGTFSGVLDSRDMTKGEYKVRYATAMTGTAVFHGKLLPYLPAKIELQHDCRVEGPKFEKAVSMFAHVLIKEAEMLSHDRNVLIVGVNVEGASFGGGKKKNSNKLWTTGKIKTSRSSFVSAVKAATVSKRRIVLNFIANVPPRSMYDNHKKRRNRNNKNNDDDDVDDSLSDTGFVTYNTIEKADTHSMEERQDEPGQLVEFSKLYTMHFQQTDRAGTPSGAPRSFAVFPFSSFCLGVFRSKHDAKFYVELHKTAEGDCWKFEERDRYNRFRFYLKTAMICKFIAGDLTSSVECLTCLLVIAGHFTVIDDIQRLMRSTAGRLRGVICWNSVICKTLDLLREDKGHHGESGQGKSRRREQGAHLGFSDSDFVNVVIQQFPAYRSKLLRALMDTDSSDVIAMQRPVRHALFDMCDYASQRLIIDDRVTTLRLMHVQYMCEALELSVSRDVFEVLTNPFFHKSHESGDTLVGLIENVTNEVIAATIKNNRACKSETDKIKDGGGGDDGDIFSNAGLRSIEAYSNEAHAAKRAREHVRVVSIPEAIKEAKKKRTVPMEIVREATLLEYVTETRLDKVIEEIAFNLFTNDKLYPNPFSNVVARIRAEALRQHVWREPDPDLVKLVAGTRARIKLVDPRIWLYKFVKHDAFGVFSALRVCSGRVVTKIAKTLARSGVISPAQGPNTASGNGVISSNASKEKPDNASAYDVSICTSLCGNAVLYSRIHSEGACVNHNDNGLKLDEALRENPSTSLTETHIFEGPRLQGALELFADYLVSQALHVNDKSESNLLLCVATGLHAINILNRDPGYDGGWYPVSHHAVQKTTNNATVARRSHSRHGLLPVTTGNKPATHSEKFYKDAQNKMYHPRYSHGEHLEVHQLRREQALCKQEIIRATKAKEPIVIELCVLIDPLHRDKKSDDSGTGGGSSSGGDNNDPFYVIVRKTIGFFYVATPSGQTTSFVPDFLRYDALYRSVWFDRDQAIDAISVICFENIDSTAAHLPGKRLADPCDAHTSFHCYYEFSLKLRVAHAYVEGDLVKAYRALFRYVLLKRNAKLLPDLIRMLQRSNIALEFDMLVSSSMLIRGLFRERFRSEGSRHKLKARVLKQHFASYKDTVELLLSRPDCLFLPGIRNAVHALLIEVGQGIDSDRGGNNTEHLEKLEELHCYLECLRLSAAISFHKNCAHLDQLCRNFCFELLPVSEVGFLK